VALPLSVASVGLTLVEIRELFDNVGSIPALDVHDDEAGDILAWAESSDEEIFTSPLVVRSGTRMTHFLLAENFFEISFLFLFFVFKVFVCIDKPSTERDWAVGVGNVQTKGVFFASTDGNHADDTVVGVHALGFIIVLGGQVDRLVIKAIIGNVDLQDHVPFFAQVVVNFDLRSV